MTILDTLKHYYNLSYEYIFGIQYPKIVLYYLDTCRYSTSYLPLWASFEKYTKRHYPDLKVEKMLYGEEKIDPDINYFPTIILYKSENNKVWFTGERRLRDLERFCEKELKNSFQS